MGLMAMFERCGRGAEGRARQAHTVVAVQFTCSWMRFDPCHQAYLPTGWQVRRWFVDAPEPAAAPEPALAPALDSVRRFDARLAVEEMLHIESERLAAQEPGEPSYLIGADARPEPVRLRWRGPLPWEVAAGEIEWERSNCWASPDPSDPEAWVPLAPRQFTLLALMRAAAAGRLSRDRFVRRAARLCDVAPDLAADWHAQPARTMRDLLEPRHPAEAVRHTERADLTHWR